MEALIPTINNLHDIFATIGSSSVESDVQLPQIVVVGSQSSGKSSVLEGIVGRDFLPRGTGIVTRRPLILNLTHVEEKDKTTRKGPDGKLISGDWAIFGHDPTHVFSDFLEVRREIERETERVTGTNKGISHEPISLRIFSSHVINLTLIDLPGIIKVPVGDQPQNIEKQITDMVVGYISNPNSIILAVTPANQDFATCEPLKIARAVDPDGARTLVVLTKLDLMDRGTNAADVLSGKLVPVKLGIIGVVNRAQADIAANKSIEESLKDESEFLQRVYPMLAARNGTPYLAKRLNNLLMHHIRDCLPMVKARVSKMQHEYLLMHNSYGRPVEDKASALLQVITRFAAAYVSTIDGTSRYMDTSELCGGARINFIFYDTFGRKLGEMNALDGLNESDILTAIKNAAGLRPQLFVPEVAFELLVQRQIKRFEEHALRCVELVHEEMQRIVQHCGIDTQQEMARFPRLYQKINEVVSLVLRARLGPTTEMVEAQMAAQLAFINTRHPEFEGEAHLISVFKDIALEDPTITTRGAVKQHPNQSAQQRQHASQLQQQHQQQQQQQHMAAGLNGVDRTGNGRGLSEIGSDALQGFESGIATSSAASSAYAIGVGNQQNGGALALQHRENGDAGFKSWLFGTQPKQSINTSGGSSTAATPQHANPGGSGGSPSHQLPINLLPAVPDKTTGIVVARQLSRREQHDIRTIERLITSYFSIVRKSIADMIPKLIMHFLVNHIRDNLQSELVRQLYKPELLDELLAESADMAQKRRETADWLQRLNKASAVIAEIRETQLW